MSAETRAHRVPPEAKGSRLDQHLVAVFPDLSRARIQALIDSGCVRVNGESRKASSRLTGGEQVALELPAPRAAKPEPQDLPLSVLYEDADLLVIDKAAGMVVHPAAGHWDGTLVNAVLHRVKDLQGIGGELRPGLVHRLDKETSGCLVLAKNEPSLEALQRAFKSRTVEKHYLALVHGTPKPSGRMETFYGRHPTQRLRFSSKLTAGKTALTEYRVLEQFPKAAWVEVLLHTGRTHQVRVHFADAGHPLLADALYGGLKRGTEALRQISSELGRQALHAWKLAFPHPRDPARMMRFEAPLPADLARALEALRALN